MVETSETPGDDYAARQILNELFANRISPADAFGRLSSFFQKYGLSQEDAYERIRIQHGFFQDGNFPRMTQVQAVNWDHLVILFELSYGIPEEEKASNNRLVRVGTFGLREDLADLAF